MGDHDSAQFHVKCLVNGVLEDFHIDTGSTFSILEFVRYGNLRATLKSILMAYLN